MMENMYGHNEELYRDKMKDAALVVLRSMFGHDHVPEPALVQATQWGHDPYAYGSYSFNKVHMHKKARKILAQSVAASSGGGGGRVFFAGEAANNAYYGTTHGALLSGQSAAKELLRRSQST